MDGHNREFQDLPDLFRRLDEVNREHVIGCNLGIRTSADIFEASQREYEQADAERRSRRRQNVSQDNILKQRQ